MIEFKGYINGAAEKRFWTRTRELVQNILIVVFLIFLPFISYFTIISGNLLLFILYCAVLAIIPLLVRIPMSKKDRLAMTPKRIYTEGKYIICVADKYEEYILINDAKELREYEEFYEIVFPFGKINDKFICQKNLLTKGSLKEFEALFRGKIVDYRKHEG